ncbi:hypothetical protein BN1708_019828, partial [Verticillium longisporum]
PQVWRQARVEDAPPQHDGPCWHHRAWPSRRFRRCSRQRWSCFTGHWLWRHWHRGLQHHAESRRDDDLVPLRRRLHGPGRSLCR